MLTRVYVYGKDVRKSEGEIKYGMEGMKVCGRGLRKNEGGRREGTWRG